MLFYLLLLIVMLTLTLRKVGSCARTASVTVPIAVDDFHRHAASGSTGVFRWQPNRLQMPAAPNQKNLTPKFAVDCLHLLSKQNPNHPCFLSKDTKKNREFVFVLLKKYFKFKFKFSPIAKRNHWRTSFQR